MNYTYLLFSIGPVQEFLAAARKTLDLFSGSMLLSHLIGKAIGVVLDNKGEMIFPSIKDKSELTLQNAAALPNRFFCKVLSDKAEDVAGKAVNAIKDELAKIANSKQVKGSFGINRDNTWDDFWTKQIANFLEVYWVLLEEDDSRSYSEKYQTIEHFLGKRKLLRDFNQLEQPGVKCSLILNFSAVHPSNKEPKKFWEEQAKKHKKYFKSGERLSAVAITKRKFLNYFKENIDKNIDDSFPSTSTIAASGFYRSLIKQAITDHDLRKSIGDYANKVQMMQEVLSGQEEIRNLPSLIKLSRGGDDFKKLIRTDGDWLFPESYNDKRIKKEYSIEEIPEIVSVAKESRDTLFNEIKKYNAKQEERGNIIGSPSKYYAVLYFDGDNMGKHLAEVKGENEHNAISNALRKFSIETIPEIIEKNERLGKVIYSGGDDALAFCALDDLFDIILEMRNKFSESLKEKINKNVNGSIGIAIAHHQTNLQQVLESARKANKFAKETLNRDSLAFALLKRSGEHSLTGAKWFPDDKNTIELLKEFSKNIKEKTISTSFIYDLENERIALEGNLHTPGLIVSEIKRLLLRRTKPSQKKEVEKFFNEQLQPYFNSLKFQDSNISSILKQFIDLLEVAQFIARGGTR